MTRIDIAYWIMILVVIATCFVVVVYLTGHGKSCLADPIKYYQDITQTTCYCSKNIFTTLK